MLANLVHHGRHAAVVAWQGLVELLHLANTGVEVVAPGADTATEQSQCKEFN